MPQLRNTVLVPALIFTWGLTCSALAEACQCSKTHIADLTTGKRTTTSKATAVRLADALRIPYDTLWMPPLAAPTGQLSGALA